MLLETLLLVGIGSVCPGDLAGPGGDAFPDGLIDANDLIASIDLWGTDDAQGDTDGDGVVGVSDLLSQLKKWGPCQYADDAVTYTYARVWDPTESTSFQASTLGETLVLDGSWVQYTVQCDGNQSQGDVLFLYEPGTASATFPNARIQFNTVEVTDFAINIFLSGAESSQDSYLQLMEITQDGTTAIGSWCIGSCNEGQNPVGGVVQDLPPGLYYLHFSGDIDPAPADDGAVGVQWWFQ